MWVHKMLRHGGILQNPKDSSEDTKNEENEKPSGNLLLSSFKAEVEVSHRLQVDNSPMADPGDIKNDRMDLPEEETFDGIRAKLVKDIIRNEEEDASSEEDLSDEEFDI